MSDRGVSSRALEAPADKTGVILIDLARLKSNWCNLARLVIPAECGAVVKADAYGLGASRVIPALWDAGCRTFFVATGDEAHEARRLVPEAVIYVLDGLLPGSAVKLQAAGARPVLSSFDEVREWALDAERMPAAIQVDTGLNRRGLGADDAAALASNASLLTRLDVTLVMSHLACADDTEHPMNARQLASFQSMRAMFGGRPASLAASDGLLLGSDYHFDLVRPGYAIYGGQASSARAAPVSPVVTVLAKVLQIREIELGETVGYSATYTASGLRLIATVAAGYADGIARTASPNGDHAGGEIAFRGRRAPIAGRVSMDLITADVTCLRDTGLARGDFVELIGPNLTLEQAGRQARTIGYEMLTRLGRRFHRIYTGDGEGRT